MAAPATFSGNRGLDLEEPLLFEQHKPGRSGVDVPEPMPFAERLGGLGRHRPVELPGLAEPQVVRHFVRLSRMNYAIDAGLYPLGSCTMKHNPRLGEALARLPGFADIHPLQPVSTVQGALGLIDALGGWLKTLTGMPAVAMAPAAGAHGELCGMMAIRAALEDRGDARSRVLAPDSAHGTNPATAAHCGYTVDSVPSDKRGRIDLGAVRAKLGPDVAAIMLTNPNTCGLFENEILEVAEATHAAGAFLYCDGANFNALVGRVRPGDLGVDAMHLNLHKTFSTPHGGGGPGSGPVAFSAALAPYAPVPWVARDAHGLTLVEHAEGESFGRMKGFHGQMGMFVRALAYMMSHGADGAQAGGGGRGARGQLRDGAARRCHDAGLSRALHARGAVRRSLPHGKRGHDARLREGDDRRGLPSDDHLFSARRPRRAAHGADGERVEGESRPLHRDAAGPRQECRRGRYRKIY